MEAVTSLQKPRPCWKGTWRWVTWRLKLYHLDLLGRIKLEIILNWLPRSKYPLFCLHWTAVLEQPPVLMQTRHFWHWGQCNTETKQDKTSVGHQLTQVLHPGSCAQFPLPSITLRVCERPSEPGFSAWQSPVLSSLSEMLTMEKGRVSPSHWSPHPHSGLRELPWITF